jgi:integrase
VERLAAGSTLADWGERWLETYVRERLAPATQRAYAFHWRRRIVPALGERSLEELAAEPLLIDDLRTALLSGGVGPSSTRHALAVLGSALGRAQRLGLISVNPVPRAGNPTAARLRAARPLSPGEVEALRRRMSARDATLVSVMALAGLRPGEALALGWEAIGRRTLAVERSVSFGELRPTKTRRARYVPLMAPLRDDLEPWRRVAGRGELLFAGADGRPWSDSMYRNWRRRRFAPATWAAGLGNVTPYALRASFASLQLHAGRPVLEVAQMLGHSPQVLLTHYAGLIAELVGTEPVSAEEAVLRARARMHVEHMR